MDQKILYIPSLVFARGFKYDIRGFSAQIDHR